MRISLSRTSGPTGRRRADAAATNAFRASSRRAGSASGSSSSGSP